MPASRCSGRWSVRPTIVNRRRAPAAGSRRRLIASLAAGRRALRDNGGCLPARDPSHSTLLDKLNPEQLAAVTLPAEPALILAGAGSGKTRS